MGITGIHILMVVFLNGRGSLPAIQFQEFSTKENCEVAAAALPRLWEKSHDLIRLNGTACVKK